MGKAEKYTRLGRDLDASSLMNAKFKPRGVLLETSRRQIERFSPQAFGVSPDFAAGHTKRSPEMTPRRRAPPETLLL